MRPVTITLRDGTKCECSVTPDAPGCFGGPPDRWSPPEPADVDVLAATDADGNAAELSEAQYEEAYDLALEALDDRKRDAPPEFEGDEWGQYDRWRHRMAAEMRDRARGE